MLQKTILMRYLTLGISFMALGFASCGNKTVEPPIRTGTYIYVNKLKSAVSLETYETGYYTPKIIKTKTIESGDSIVSKSVSEAPFPFTTGSGSGGADSIILRFSDNKCATYINFGTDYRQQLFSGSIFNLKEYDNYSEELVNRRAYTLRYTIDSTDYKKATPCK